MSEVLPKELSPEKKGPIHLDDELAARFDEERLSLMAADYLVNGPFGDIRTKASGKNFVVGIVDALDPKYSDLGRSTETIVFSDVFKRTLTDVYEDYRPYDAGSTFLVDLDISDIDNPRLAGSIRMIKGKTEEELKSIKDLIVDSPDNPWRAELGWLLFEKDEAYDQSKVWQRLCQRAGVTIKPEESHDVATLAVMEGYRGQGGWDRTSVNLYHACLKFALANGMKNLVSIQDVEPLKQLQEFVSPFDEFDGLSPRPYGGPYLTIPAFAVLERSIARVRKDRFLGGILLDGEHLGDETLRLQDIDPVTYGR